MNLIIRPNHQEHDPSLSEWERLAFYNLVCFFRMHLLDAPNKENLTIKVNTIKDMINFSSIKEAAYSEQYRRHFILNEDHRSKTVIDQLFNLLGSDLNFSLELNEKGQSKRFSFFSSIAISKDLQTFMLALNPEFCRLILEHYRLLIHHEWIKAGLTDLAALYIFDKINNHSNVFSMIVPLDITDEYEEALEMYQSGIEEINAKADLLLLIEPIISNGQPKALKIRENYTIIRNYSQL